jgi:hypothetical protein
MYKTLIIIAAAAFGLCLLLLVIAGVAHSLGLLGGADGFANITGAKPIASSANSRTWAWTGDSFKSDVPIDIQYKPNAKGPARIVVRGAADELARITFHNGKLAFKQRIRKNDFDNVEAVLTGAVVKNFSFAGRSHFSFGAIRQDKLDVNIAGRGDMDSLAPGHVDKLTLNIAGRSDDHLGKLTAREAHIHIAGRGNVEIAPSDEADVDILGRGDIKLMTKPKSFNTHVLGAINVTDAAGNSLPAK